MLEIKGVLAIRGFLAKGRDTEWWGDQPIWSTGWLTGLLHAVAGQLYGSAERGLTLANVFFALHVLSFLIFPCGLEGKTVLIASLIFLVGLVALLAFGPVFRDRIEETGPLVCLFTLFGRPRLIRVVRVISEYALPIDWHWGHRKRATDWISSILSSS